MYSRLVFHTNYPVPDGLYDIILIHLALFIIRFNDIFKLLRMYDKHSREYPFSRTHSLTTFLSSPLSPFLAMAVGKNKKLGKKKKAGKKM